MKTILIFFSFLCSISVNAQNLGDYMEIDGVPGFVFYLDETGEHGMVMSMFPITASWEKLQVKKFLKEGVLTEMHMKKLSKYAVGKKKIKVSKAEMSKYYNDLSKVLGDDGEENKKLIKEYCANNNLPLELFTGQAFAESLGEEWFIPGDKELTLFADYLAGGLGKENIISGLEMKEKIKDPIALFIVQWMITCQGLLSSTVESIGFSALMPEVTKNVNMLNLAKASKTQSYFF